MTRRDLFHKWLFYALALAPVWLLDAQILPRLPLFGVTPMLLPLALTAVAAAVSMTASAILEYCMMNLLFCRINLSNGSFNEDRSAPSTGGALRFWIQRLRLQASAPRASMRAPSASVERRADCIAPSQKPGSAASAPKCRRMISSTVMRPVSRSIAT